MSDAEDMGSGSSSSSDSDDEIVDVSMEDASTIMTAEAGIEANPYYYDGHIQVGAHTARGGVCLEGRGRGVEVFFSPSTTRCVPACMPGPSTGLRRARLGLVATAARLWPGGWDPGFPRRMRDAALSLPKTPGPPSCSTLHCCESVGCGQSCGRRGWACRPCSP